MYCNSCGSLIKDGQSFCANCGAPVTQPVQPAPQPAVQQVQYAQPVYQPVQQVPVAAPVASSEPLRAEPAKKDKYSRFARKRVVISGILGIVVGCFGVHNFVMKQPVRGVLHILMFFLPILSVIFLFFDIISSGGFSDTIGFNYIPDNETLWMSPCYISWIWGLIEGIILLATSSKYHGGNK